VSYAGASERRAKNAARTSTKGEYPFGMRPFTTVAGIKRREHAKVGVLEVGSECRRRFGRIVDRAHARPSSNDPRLAR
jgi:hypothetical protein